MQHTPGSNPAILVEAHEILMNNSTRHDLSRNNHLHRDVLNGVHNFSQENYHHPGEVTSVFGSVGKSFLAPNNFPTVEVSDVQGYRRSQQPEMQADLQSLDMSLISN